MTDNIARQEDFVSKVRKLGVAIIKYKEDKDRATLSFNEVITLKKEVLQAGHELNLTDEIILQMLYDATKKSLTEYYLRKLFSDDFNRKMLPKIPEIPENLGGKEPENSSHSNPDMIALKDKLEGTEAEIQFLKENKRAKGFVKVESSHYHKLKNTVTSAIKNQLPYIRFWYEGELVKDIVEE